MASFVLAVFAAKARRLKEAQVSYRAFESSGLDSKLCMDKADWG
jgi:hypothetical protein